MVFKGRHVGHTLMTLSSYAVLFTSGFLVPFRTGFKVLMKTCTESILVFLLGNEDFDIEIATPGKA